MSSGRWFSINFPWRLLFRRNFWLDFPLITLILHMWPSEAPTEKYWPPQGLRSGPGYRRGCSPSPWSWSLLLFRHSGVSHLREKDQLSEHSNHCTCSKTRLPSTLSVGQNTVSRYFLPLHRPNASPRNQARYLEHCPDPVAGPTRSTSRMVCALTLSTFKNGECTNKNVHSVKTGPTANRDQAVSCITAGGSHFTYKFKLDQKKINRVVVDWRDRNF